MPGSLQVLRRRKWGGGGIKETQSRASGREHPGTGLTGPDPSAAPQVQNNILN